MLAEPDLPEPVRRKHASSSRQCSGASPRCCACCRAPPRANRPPPRCWPSGTSGDSTRHAKYAEAAAATGQLAVSEDECRDVLAATMDGTLWQRLVAERGWSDERFAAWLGKLWTSAMVS